MGRSDGRRRIGCVSLLLVLAACSDGAPAAATDAGTNDLRGSDRMAPTLVLRRHAAFARALGAATPLALDGDRLRRADRGGVASRAGFIALDDLVDATLPTRSTGPVHIARAGHPDVSVDVTPIALTDVVASVEHTGAHDVVVHHDVARDTDAVRLLARGRVEELLVVRSAQAPGRFAYRLTLGSGVLDLRHRDGKLEVLDRHGVVALETEPAYAIDAAGRRADVLLALSADPQTPGVHRLEISVSTAGLEYPIAIDPAWIATTGHLLVGRWKHTATLLGNGKVAVGAGLSWGDSATAELYDPVSKAFSAAGGIAPDRGRSTATLLTNGRVLLVGGETNALVRQQDSFLFDPTTNVWTKTVASPAFPRTGSVAVRLASGKVFVAGGDQQSTAEAFDPSGNTWGTLATMSTRRYLAGFGVLGDGRILLAGGRTGFSNVSVVFYSTAEIYDPTANTWAAAASMTSTRYEPSSISLANGKVLLFGGTRSATTPENVAYDAPTNAWSAIAATPTGHGSQGSAVLLATGKVLFVGGNGGASSAADLYDPTTNTWTTAGSMSAPRYFATATVLASGDVLIAGGWSSPANFGSGPTSSAELFIQLAAGAACAVGYECRAGHCVDGVCCDAACGGACQACDVPTQLGTCSPVPSGSPHGARTCGTYLKCSAGVCATTCTADADCLPSSYCMGTQCVAKKTGASTCSASNECASGSCADGVCCDAACGRLCEACDVAGKIGQCTVISGAPRAARGGCGGGGAGTPCGARCDGIDASVCHFVASGAPACSSNGCVTSGGTGTETHASTCDGMGACNDIPRLCGSYACGATSCRTTCALDADCASGFVCKAGACAPLPGLGEACTSTSQCRTGLLCTDAVCCGVASCGVGSSCATPAKKGTCAKVQGAPCKAANECGTGFCVDGLCCDGACDGQCEACDGAGKLGICAPIVGAPHAARTTCTDGGAEPCKAKHCDGKDRATCVAFAAAATECKPGGCATGNLTSPSACDGAGACVEGSTKSCAPYACAGTAACRVACDFAEHCAPGFACTEGTCTPVVSGATCSGDGLTSIAADGTAAPCAPFRCGGLAKTCQTTCASSDECAPGNLCASGSCIADTPAAADSGGCVIAPSAPREPSAPPLVVACALLAGLALRLTARKGSGR